MRRREFIGLLTGATVSLPRKARAAESGKVYRIALVHPARPVSELVETGDYSGFPAFLKELRRLGYVEGSNLVLLRFSGGGDPAGFASMARDVVGVGPELIATVSSRLILSFKAATSTIPVVGVMSDPIAFGIVTSLAHPDASITGVVTDAGLEIWGKRLAMLLEAVPTAKSVGFLISEALWDGTMGAAFRQAAQHLSVSIVGSPLRGMISEAEYRRVFKTLEQAGAHGLVVSEMPESNVHGRLIAGLAENARLPAVYPNRDFTEVGGLMAYGNDLVDQYRRVAGLVDMILKGAKPRDLPIYQVTKYQTVINLKTARTIGLELPATLLAQADAVIE